MLENRSKNRPSNKFNDKLRHKDGGLVLYARQSNRRERHAARRDTVQTVREAQFDLLLERVINKLCREAGLAI